MLRYVLAAALGLAVVVSAGSNTDAQDKKTEKKATPIEGKLVCTKCTLSETDKCGHAVKVKDGEKTVTYYLDNGKTFHGEVCPAGNELAVKVTGTLSEKEGKKMITGAKIEKVK